jgi:hypothetical protein
LLSDTKIKGGRDYADAALLLANLVHKFKCPFSCIRMALTCGLLSTFTNILVVPSHSNRIYNDY